MNHYKNYVNNILLIFFIFFSNKIAYAASSTPTLGQAATNILEPVSLLASGFYKLCYIIGGSLILGAALQYKNYRDNPSAVRFSTPVILLLLGIALILLPIISMVSPASQAANTN